MERKKCSKRHIWVNSKIGTQASTRLSITLMLTFTEVGKVTNLRLCKRIHGNPLAGRRLGVCFHCPGPGCMAGNEDPANSAAQPKKVIKKFIKKNILIFRKYILKYFKRKKP